MMKRRTFLKGAGGIIFGLPFLESLYTGPAYGQEEASKFGVFIRQPSGVVQNKYWPKSAGALNAASLTGTSLSPLIPIASQLLLVKGIKHGFGIEECDHSTGGVQCFTGAKPIGKGSGVKAGGESLDTRIARELGGGKSPLTLYAAGNNQGRGADMIAFNKANDLRTGQRSPWAAYSALFGTASTMADPQVLIRSSVNDYVKEELKELMNSPLLSAADKIKLQAHVENVRTVEKTIASLSDAQVKNMQSKGTRTSYGSEMPEIIKMHMDIIVLAIATKTTNAACLQILDIIGETPYAWNGENLPAQHENSHGTGDDARATQVKYDAIHHELFKYMVDGFNKYTVGSKTLMDAGFIYMTSEVGDGMNHSHTTLPTLIAGSANGALKQGQFVSIGETTNNKVLNTLGAALGLKNGNAPLDNFGDSSLAKGSIAEMKA